MPDAVLRDVTAAATADDEVVFSATMLATMPDGDALVQEFRVVYSLSDGLIVRACAIYDPARIAAMSENALTQFQLPPNQ
jgi:ketosteroid isomerase-like protein